MYFPFLLVKIHKREIKSDTNNTGLCFYYAEITAR